MLLRGFFFLRLREAFFRYESFHTIENLRPTQDTRACDFLLLFDTTRNK